MILTHLLTKPSSETNYCTSVRARSFSCASSFCRTADFSGYQSDQDPDYVCPAKSDDSNDSDSGSNSSISDDEDEDQNKDKEEMED